MVVTETLIQRARHAGACSEAMARLKPGTPIDRLPAEWLGWCSTAGVVSQCDVDAASSELVADPVRLDGIDPYLLGVSGYGYGDGYGDGDGYGYGYGDGDGDGYGYGYGYGDGYGYCYGYGYGDGYGYGSGDGYGYCYGYGYGDGYGYGSGDGSGET